jgi:hypothetical protein
MIVAQADAGAIIQFARLHLAMALPTCAVLISWLFVAAVVAGCGFLTRRALLGLFAEPIAGLVCADLWIGFAVLVAYLQIWNLVLWVGLLAWVAPLVAGGMGLALAARPSLRLRRPPRLAYVLPLALAVVWLANKSLGPAEDYDLGLYHLGAIRYAMKFATIPGLGNLQERLSSGNAHLLFVALLEHGPWANAGFHLANGLLVVLLLVELGSRIGLVHGRPDSYSGRMALLLLPATVVLIGVRPTHRLSSPNLDLAVFVLVVVGALYLAECVERQYQPAAILASTGAFATASATRPLYWITTALAACLIGAAAGRERRELRLRGVRALILGCTIPGALAVGWIGRQAVLSGYPLFPLTIGGLHADWRVPLSVVRRQNRINYAWARWPGVDPNVVLASWRWLHAWWLTRWIGSFDVGAPLALLATLVPSFLWRWRQGKQVRRPVAPMLAVVLPSLVVLVVWFFIAPDPRFVFGPLWLVPVALAAWVVPAEPVRWSTWFVIVGVAISVLVVVGIERLRWFVPAALVAPALVAAALRSAGRRVSLPQLAQAAIIAAALAPIGVVAYQGAFSLVVSDRGGALGTPVEPFPPLGLFTTHSGLQVVQPLNTDQCFFVEPCTTDSNSRLRLRGTGLGSGFSVEPPRPG